MKLKNWTTFIVILIYINGCTSDNKNMHNLQTNMSHNDTTKNVVYKHQALAAFPATKFTHQDSIEYHALDNYFFGKMKSDNSLTKLPSIAKMKFSVHSYSDYAYSFSHDCREELFNSIQPETSLKFLAEIFTQKYGAPKKINSQQAYNASLLSPSLWVYSKPLKFITPCYLWDTEYKRIIIGTTIDKEAKEEKATKFINIEITNKKLEQEQRTQKEKDNEELLKKESLKI